MESIEEIDMEIRKLYEQRERLSKGRMLDLSSPEAVEIHISSDGRRIWVNVVEVKQTNADICRLRISGIGKLTLVDDRKG